MMKSIILFDMDGTITPPRKSIEIPMIQSLRNLTEVSRIGIVSGSDFDYIMQQCESLFDMGGIDLRDIDLLPCNGTKFYSWKTTEFKIYHEENMMTFLKKDSQYQKLVRKILTLQLEIINGPLMFTQIAGTFIQYRGSILNWCPIGRDANNHIRADFIDLDKKEKIRENYRDKIEKFIDESNIPITTVIGGDTSIDIYPDGWDKTYALRHYPQHNVFFVGDRCNKGGNDYSLFEKLNSIGHAFKTSGPKETAKIIANNIIPQIQEV